MSDSELHRWAVAQMTGSSSVSTNLTRAQALIAKAAQSGCELVALPENTTFMGSETQKASVAEPLEGDAVGALRSAARDHGIYVLVGSVVERSADPDRPHNTSVLISPDGSICTSYRKIHLFDVEVAGDRTYLESDFVTAGSPDPVVASVGDVTVGLTICFDLRFPWLYTALARAGVEVVFVPAAFTVPTGRDHWETLLRARAIENQCFVLAPAQYGVHDTGRQTFGRSVIIDPWGTVLARVPDGGDLAIAELDVSRVRALRRRMPMRSRQLL